VHCVVSKKELVLFDMTKCMSKVLFFFNRCIGVVSKKVLVSCTSARQKYYFFSIGA
jgi:hypothetical protein